MAWCNEGVKMLGFLRLLLITCPASRLLTERSVSSPDREKWTCRLVRDWPCKDILEYRNVSRTSGEGEFIVPLWRLGDKYIISAGLVGETESVKCFISRHKNDVVVVAISVIALCLSVSVSLPLLCLCMSVCLSLSVCLSVCLSLCWSCWWNRERKMFYIKT